jgi:AbrB family looped-hinge helix DNA binding protein
MIHTMNVKLDRSGRIVVPKRLRDRFGLKPDLALEVEEHADGVFLRVPTPHPTMVQVDGLWVHQGTAPANADWACVLGDVRDERRRAVGAE